MTQHSNLLTTKNSVLLLIDIQDRLIQAMPEESAEDMREYSARLTEAANLLDVPVFLTEQYPQGLGATIDTLNEKLSTSTKRFEKTSFSCVAVEGFMEALNQSGRKQVIIAGQGTYAARLSSAYIRRYVLLT